MGGGGGERWSDSTDSSCRTWGTPFFIEFFWGGPHLRPKWHSGRLLELLQQSFLVTPIKPNIFFLPNPPFKATFFSYPLSNPTSLPPLRLPDKEMNGPYILTIILTIAYLQFMPKSFQTYCPIMSMVFKDALDVEGTLLDLKQNVQIALPFIYFVCFTWRWENVTTPRSILGSDTTYKLKYTVTPKK